MLASIGCQDLTAEDLKLRQLSPAPAGELQKREDEPSYQLRMPNLRLGRNDNGERICQLALNGQNVDVTIAVENNGTARAGEFDVTVMGAFTDQETRTELYPIQVFTTRFPQLDPGIGVQVAIGQIVLPHMDSDWYVTATVQIDPPTRAMGPRGEVWESNERDNGDGCERTVNVGGPNLIGIPGLHQQKKLHS